MNMTLTSRHSLRFFASTILLSVLAASVSAQVSTDGTLGRAGALSGPAFQVTPDLGRQVGGNLFHSFSKLNLALKQAHHGRKFRTTEF